MPDFDSITELVMAREGVMVQSRAFLEYKREQLIDSRGQTLVRIIKVRWILVARLCKKYLCFIKKCGIFSILLGGRCVSRQECSFPFSVGIGYQTHSPLIKKFNRVINWIVESGLFRYWKVTTLRMAKKVR